MIVKCEGEHEWRDVKGLTMPVKCPICGLPFIVFTAENLSEAAVLDDMERGRLDFILISLN